MKIVRTERPLKELALPVICDMAHSGKVGRKYLWQNRGLEFFVSLLSEPYWQVSALEAILVWLQEEQARIEERLLHSKSVRALIVCFTSSKPNTFENLLEPFQKLCRISPVVAEAMGQTEFFDRTLQKLTHPKAVVRLNLLKIVRSICDASGEQQEELLTRSGLLPMILWLAEHDAAVLVKNMAGEFAKKTRKASEKTNGGTAGKGNFRASTISSGTAPRGSGLGRSKSSVHKARKPEPFQELEYSNIPEEKIIKDSQPSKPTRGGLKFERRRRQKST